jgi:hypothetical protein
MADGGGGCTGGVGWTGGIGCTGGVGCTGGGSGGVVVQAASESATAVSGTSKLRRVNNIRIAMWVLMIEACVAFFLLVFIVWWTMYSGKKPVPRKPALEDQSPADEQDKLQK